VMSAHEPLLPRTIRGGLAMLLGALAAVVLIGVPTDVLPNPWFTRMTPVSMLDQVLLGANAGLFGLLAASAAMRAGRPARGAAQATTGGVLAWLAIGCPVCNKIVVALLGASGAMSWYAPLQPILGVLGLMLAVSALVVQRRRDPACGIDAPAT
jgi:hypothetical protein